MTNSILFNQDMKKPQATLAAFLDFKQGFNQCQYSIFIDFQPQLTTNDSDPIDIVEEYKILGYVLRSDLKATSNTDCICQRAYKRMLILRRLK